LVESKRHTVRPESSDFMQSVGTEEIARSKQTNSNLRWRDHLSNSLDAVSLLESRLHS